jgi:hypothetical protein
MGNLIPCLCELSVLCGSTSELLLFLVAIYCLSLWIPDQKTSGMTTVELVGLSLLE